MRHMKVLMIGWEYPPRITGGLAVACQGIARSLARRGHEVIFLVPRLTGHEHHEPGIELIDLRAEMEFFTPEEIARVREFRDRSVQLSPYGRVTALDRFGRETQYSNLDHQSAATVFPIEGGYGDNLYADIHTYAQFASIMARKRDFDVIHAHDWITFPAGIAVADATGRPLVCHVHATEFDRSGERVNQYIYDMERTAFHRATAVVTVSNYTKNILVDRYGVDSGKIMPAHNAIDFEFPAELIEQKKVHKDHIILFLGRITFQKGPDYFVRAAKIVVEHVPNVRFVMVGTGDMYRRMIEMAADMGLGKYFHYTGFLDRDQVKSIYAMSDLYVMPSVSEPFGISPLEAMMHGVPVIVSRQSGVSEVISNCIKVDFWNVDEIAEKIITIVKDRSLRETLRESGRAEAAALNWDDTAHKLEEVYFRLVPATREGW